MTTKLLAVLCACPDEATAARIARELVEGRLAACVNRLPGVHSTYRWDGAVHDEPEVLLIVKTTRERYQALEMRLKALHPYELPEIIALPVEAGSAGYIDWVGRETAQMT